MSSSSLLLLLCDDDDDDSSNRTISLPIPLLAPVTNATRRRLLRLSFEVTVMAALADA
jgi:hypothetical protein